VNICVCYSLEIILNTGLDVSFDNTQERNGRWDKAGEVISTKLIHDEISRRNVNGR
jgi:hypothetical protein